MWERIKVLKLLRANAVETGLISNPSANSLLLKPSVDIYILLAVSFLISITLAQAQKNLGFSGALSGSEDREASRITVAVGRDWMYWGTLTSRG